MIPIKTIKIQQTYYDFGQLYRAAAGSKARRGLAGYAIKMGHGNDTIFGGAMHLLCELESLRENEVYTLECHESPEVKRDILGLAEAALAGVFHKLKFEIPEKEVRQMIQNFDKLPPLGC